MNSLVGETIINVEIDNDVGRQRPKKFFMLV
jgi:hypothetical protein